LKGCEKAVTEKVSLQEHRHAKKQKEILYAAIKLLSKKEIQQVTMEEIASHLLMTKGSLYYYFKNKDDLIVQCHELFLSNSVSELLELIKKESTATEKLKQAIKFHVNYVIDNKGIYNLILEPGKEFPEKYLPRILKKRSEYEKIFDQLITEGIESKEFNITEVRMARMISLGAMNWIQQWYTKGGEQDKDEIAEIYSQYLLKIFI